MRPTIYKRTLARYCPVDEVYETVATVECLQIGAPRHMLKHPCPQGWYANTVDG